MGKVNETGYSAEVRLWLQCADQTLPLAQASSTFVIAKEPIDLPPNSPAQIILNVDETEYRRNVTLIAGMSKHQPEAMILERDCLPF